MVRLGKTFGNLMVDVQASNDKLRARARRAVAIATAAPEDQVAEAISCGRRRHEGGDRLAARRRRRADRTVATHARQAA